MKPSEEEYKAKSDKLQELIKGKGRHLAEECMKEHKSLSHYPKETQEALLRGAEIALMDRLIMFLNRI